MTPTNTPVQSDVERWMKSQGFTLNDERIWSAPGMFAISHGIAVWMYQQILVAELKLVSQITTDKGDAYYQSIPLYHFQEQLRAALKAQQHP